MGFFSYYCHYESFQKMLLPVNMSNTTLESVCSKSRDDGQDNTLLKAVDRYQKEGVVLDDGLDQILTQSS